MYNDLFTIGPITVHGYGLMIGIGVILAVLLADRRAKSRGMNRDLVYNIVILCLIAGFLGAKILYIAIDIQAIIADPKLLLSGGGFVVYGGIIGGVISALIYCRIRKVSFLAYFDLLIPSVALAQGFGRIGCFLAGCCYGRETDSILGIVFHQSALAPNNVKLIPTQLFSSAGDFLITWFLILFARQERQPGKVGALYLVLYGTGRFVIEFFRDDYRGTIGGILSTSQFISIFTVVFGVCMLFLKKLPGRTKPIP